MVTSYEADSDDDLDGLEPELVDLIADLSDRWQAGESLDPQTLANDYPKWSAELLRILPAIHLIANDARETRNEIGRVAGLPEIPRTVGDFEIVREAGRGGMGIVYEAIQCSPRRRVALKVLAFGSADATRIARFRLEAHAAGLLAHDHIAAIFASGEHAGISFFAMRFIDGIPLHTMIGSLRVSASTLDDLARVPQTQLAVDRSETQSDAPPRSEVTLFDLGEPGSPMFYRSAARLGIEAAAALQHAHEQGVVHRDIKPANLMVDRKGKLWVTDFGLAQLLGTSGLTRTNDRMGTPRYMSPEQVRAEPVGIDYRTDIYSLGVTLYELVTLTLAFSGSDQVQVLSQILNNEPKPARKVEPRVPKDLETILLKSMNKQASARYASAGHMAQDLARFLDSRPIQAQPPNLLDHGGKFVKRHRGLTVVGIVGLLAFFSSLIVGIVLVDRERDRALIMARDANRANIELLRERELSSQLLYASQLRLAERARIDGQLGIAQQLLRGLGPSRPDETDRREFTWSYLWSQTRRQIRLLGEAPAVVRVSAISRDRRFLGVADVDRGLAVHDLRSERVVWTASLDELGLGYDVEPSQMAFSPDGLTLAVSFSGRDDSPERLTSVQLYEVRTGRRLLDRLLSLDRGRVTQDVAFADQGRTLVIRHARDKEFRARIQGWDLGPDPAHPRPSPVYESGDSEMTAIAPDGDTFLALTPAGDRAIFASSNGRAIVTLRSAPTGVDLLAAYSPDGRTVAGCDGTRTKFFVWDTTDGRLLHEKSGFDRPLHQIFVAPKGRAVATVDTSQKVQVHDFDRQTSTTVFEAAADPETDRTAHMVFTSDGLHFLAHRTSFFQPDAIELRSVADARVVARLPNSQRGLDSTWHLDQNGQGESSLIFGIDRYLWNWSWESSERADPVIRHSDEAWAVAFSPDGRLLATGSNDTNEVQTIRLWDPRTGTLIRGWKGHSGTVTGLAISPDGLTLISSSLDDGNPVSAWDLATGEPRGRLMWPSGGARCLAIRGDGKLLAAGGTNGSVQVWDLKTLRPVLHLKAHEDRVHTLAFSPDGQTLATGSDDRMARLWEVSTGRLLRSHESSEEIFALAFHPNGRTLAVAGRDGKIAILDSATFALVHLIRSEDSALRTLAFSPDGKTLAAAGLGRTVHCWDPATPQELLVLEKAADQINALAFSPDGKTLAACDHTGVVRLYRSEHVSMQHSP